LNSVLLQSWEVDDRGMSTSTGVVHLVNYTGWCANFWHNGSEGILLTVTVSEMTYTVWSGTLNPYHTRLMM